MPRFNEKTIEWGILPKPPRRKRKSKEKRKRCCLCKRIINGFGHNPFPLGQENPQGRCCFDCNIRRVIPARLQEVKAVAGQTK